MADFIQLAKEKPGALKMSGGSIASRENIVRQLIMKVTGVRWAFISFPSGGERIAALLGGHVDIMIVEGESNTGAIYLTVFYAVFKTTGKSYKSNTNK